MFLLYKTTNLLNGKVYIGVHECTDTCRHLVEGKCTYLGSGSAIGRAISKYGKQNFVRETLSTFLTEDAVLNAERLMVDEEWVKSSKNYNCTVGGGKPPSRKGSVTAQSTKEKISIASRSRSKELSETAKHTMKIRMENGGWTDEQIKARVATRKSTTGYPTQMWCCNTKEAISKRVATRKENNNMWDASNLRTPEIFFARTKTRIINQMKKGKVFNEKTLLKYGITSADTQDTPQLS